MLPTGLPHLVKTNLAIFDSSNSNLIFEFRFVYIINTSKSRYIESDCSHSGEPVVVGDLDSECEGLLLEDLPQPGLPDHQVPVLLLQQVQRAGGALG